MRKLFQFLARYSTFGLFLVLGTIAFALFVNNNRYPQSVFFSSSNYLVSYLYQVSSSVTGFFNLRPENDRLLVQNVELKNRIAVLENRLALFEELNKQEFPDYVFAERDFRFIPARVTQNSTGMRHNFITLNKGRRDGVRAGMGVVNAEGVVGIVTIVSNRFSTAISVLNPMSQISSKIARNNQVGPLVWDGLDYRYALLTDIPRHIELQVGDLIVTSGLTPTFPAGVPIGVIDSFSIGDGDAFHTVRVRLAVNFRTISSASVFYFKNYDELRELNP